MTHDDDCEDQPPDAKPRMQRSRKGKPLGDYEVGYGRPPAATRFTSSGNPKGRPPGARSLRALVSEALDAKIKVREGGRDRKMSKRQIGATKIANRFAENADDKTAALIVKLEMADRASGDGQVAPAAESMADQAQRKAILDWCFQARMQAQQALDADNAAADPGKTGEADETDEADSTTGDDDHDD